MVDGTTGGGTALVERVDVEALTRSNIKTQADLADRMRRLQDHVFLLSPMGQSGSTISAGYEIAPIPILIDPSVDAESGRGAEVYHQASIHKRRKVADGQWEPVECSLNHYGLLKILTNFGVNVRETRWLQDGVKERHLFVCETDGDIIDFTGQLRMLPTGIGSVDARDGSADIGEWTPEEWARRVEVADLQRKKVPPKEQWKVKPEPINGWTAERVMQVRRFGRQLAKTKSLNGLARKLGVRQSYTIEELRRKPFVILRAVFQPDMTDPEIRRMVTAANLGARDLLYPGASLHAPVLPPVTHAPGEIGQMLTGEVVAEPEAPERMQTAAAPADAQEVTFDDPPPPPATAPDADETYMVTKVLRKGEGAEARYFVETKQGVTLYTPDAAIAKACAVAAKDGQPRLVPTERVVVGGQPYRQAIEVSAVGGLKL